MRHRTPRATLLGAMLLLGGCVFAPGSADRTQHSVYDQERFRRDETFSRLFDASPTNACEAARRALLSQGYVITAASASTVKGSKRFQPEGDVHLEIAFTIVCVSENATAELATTFVSAQQDRYVLRRRANTTSLGVGGLGSISVPLSSSEDALVKVGSETIASPTFYERFFALLQRMLVDLGNGPADQR